MDKDISLKTYAQDEVSVEAGLQSVVKPFISAKWFAWFVCALGATFYFYEYLLRVSPSVMTHQLMETYQISATGLGHLSACYYYVYAPMQLPVGVLMDRYGPRLLLLFACLSCALGTYLFSCSSSIRVAELGRFLVGFGSAFAFVGVLKLATIWLPPNRFAIVSGMTMALGMVGGLTGENLLNQLVTHYGWKATTYGSAVVGTVLTAILFFFLHDGFKSGHAAADAKQLPDFKSAFSGLFKIIKNSQIWINGLIGCLMYIPTSVFAELWGPPFFVSVYKFSETTSVAVVSMIFLGWAIGGFVVGWASDRLGKRRAPMTVGSLFAAALLALVFYYPHMSAWTVGAIFLIFGVFSSAQVLVFAVGHEISCSKSAGTAIALTNMFVMLGGVLFQPIVGILLDMFWSGNLGPNGVHIYAAKEFQIALSVLPIGLLLSVVLTFALRETHGMVKNSDVPVKRVV